MYNVPIMPLCLLIVKVRPAIETVAVLCEQGLFERHKLIVATQLAMVVLRKLGELPAAKFDFLLRCPRRHGIPNPIVEWLPDPVWASLQALKVGIISHIAYRSSRCSRSSIA